MTKLRALLAVSLTLQSFGPSALEAAAQTAGMARAPGAASGIRSTNAPPMMLPGSAFGPSLTALTLAPMLSAPAFPLSPLVSPIVSPLTVRPAVRAPSASAGLAVTAAATARQSPNLAQVRAAIIPGPLDESPPESNLPVAAVRSHWESFWSGARPSPASVEVNAPTQLFGVVAAGKTLSLPAAAPLLAIASPVTTLAGAAGAVYATTRASDKGIDWLFKKLGWSSASGVAKLIGRGAVVAAAIVLPFQAPALWILAAPYLSGGGYLLAALGADHVGRVVVNKLADSLRWSAQTRSLAENIVRLTTWSAGGLFGLNALGYSPLDMAATLIASVKPYLGIGGFTLGAYAVSRLSNRALDWLAKEGNWRNKTKSWAHLVKNVVVLVSGTSLAMAHYGVSSKGIAATFGLGGIAVAVASQKFIGNFLESVKALIGSPYTVGDRIKLNSEGYTVLEMGWRHVKLQNDTGWTTDMPYSGIAGMAITISGDQVRRLTLPSRSRPLSSLLGATLNAAAFDLPRAVGWVGAGLALAIGLPALSAALAMPWLAASVPYLQAGAALWVTSSVSRWLSTVVTNIGQSFNWGPKGVNLARLGVHSLVYIVGGMVGLRMAGVTWSMLMAGLGASTVAIGWAGAGIISNLLDAFSLRLSRRLEVGDAVKIKGIEGTIVDINLKYVVIEHEDLRTYIPYALSNEIEKKTAPR